jgi:hypothetical protein
MTEEIDCSYTDELICPYCGYEDSDSWEYFSRLGDSTNAECGECGKTFRASQNVTVDYSSEKLPCMNGEGEHNWTKWEECFPFDNSERRYCRECSNEEIRKKGSAE